MIGGRLEQGDVKVEVESERTYNVSPPILADTSSQGNMQGALSNGSNWVLAPGGSQWLWARPNWQVDAPDAFGNRRWWVNALQSKKVFGIEGFGSNLQGTPGKYYSMSLDVRTYVSAMNGNTDYIAQPPARCKLYATNGIEAQDVLIAESTVLNPILPSNNGWPFHPGYREWKLDLSSTAPMPVGKTYFRFSMEYDNDFTANKSIYLPADYSYPAVPSNLYMFSVRFDSLDVKEHSAAQQAWAPTATTGRTFSYDYEKNRCYYNTGYNATASDGIASTFVIKKDSLIPAKGMKLAFFSNFAETNLRVQLTRNGTTTTKTIGNVPFGWQTTTFPASAFSSTAEEQTVTIKFVGRGFQHMAIFADGTWADSDGFSFWNYDDWSGWVSSVDINRYDTEVSTASIVLREKPEIALPGDGKFDTGPYFEQGKKMRIQCGQIFEGQSAKTWFNLPFSTFNTLFTGEINRRTARYPKKARKEVTLFCTNGFPLLQEKTSWAMINLNDYLRTIRSLGLPVQVDTTVHNPLERDPNMSLTGEVDVDNLWALRDMQNGFTFNDALKLTRNSQFGYVFLNRFNVLNLRSNLDSSIMATFHENPESGESSFSDIDVHYDSDSIINSVLIREYQQVESIATDTYERTDAIVESEQTVYDTDSIKKYRKAEIEFKTFKKSSYDEIGMHILDKYANPEVKASMITVPIKDEDTATKSVLIDIYSLVTIKYEDRIDSTYRVNRIKHTLIPGQTWRMELGFAINHDGVYW